jgi:DNA helicase II / ATP-dependent DNA helicase PcrA
MKGIELNEKQQEAVNHLEGPMAVLSVAGSGKTMVLTERIINLIDREGVEPDCILAITFAKKAVMEILSRLSQRLNGESERVWVSTFHSLGYRILKQNGYPVAGFRIVQGTEQWDLFKESVKRAKVKGDAPDLFRRISLAKNQLLTPADLEKSTIPADKAAAKVFRIYELEKRRRRLVDFDDLLYLSHRLLSENKGLLNYYQDRFRHILVDEFQDSSNVMLELTRLLSDNHRNVWVCGDDDQSIHGFRGAHGDAFLSWEKHYNGALKTITMSVNYRSSGNIITAANTLISRNKKRVTKQMETGNGPGDEVNILELMNEQAEAEYIAGKVLELKKEKYKQGDIAVLCRIYRLMPAIEGALIQSNIPYVSREGFLFLREDMKTAVHAMEYLLTGENAHNLDLELLDSIRSDFYPDRKDLTLKDAFDIAACYVMMKTHRTTDVEEDEPLTRLYLDALEYLVSQHKNLDGFLKFRVRAISHQKKSNNDKVHLITIHQAKGLQFKCVFIPGLNEGVLPHINSIDQLRNIEEERRLFYVAMTRAMEKLYITHRRKQDFQDITMPSRFLSEIS